jgi:exopolyphosphatase
MVQTYVYLPSPCQLNFITGIDNPLPSSSTSKSLFSLQTQHFKATKMSSSLPKFLRLARDAVFKPSTSRPLTIVLGNTSADLDSFISAVVFAYFHSKGGDSRIYVPLLNLTDVPSSDLWRLRPEYGTAVRLAVHGPSDESGKDAEKSLLQDLVTLADIRADPALLLHATFTADTEGKQVAIEQETILVDHNAPSVSGMSSTDLSSRLNLIGAIDHHQDEEVIPSSAHPRVIKTGVGSCTSLIVQHLQDTSLWDPPSPTSSPSTDPPPLTTLALLALAPILIDTANLTSPATSRQDHSSAYFLLSHIHPVYPTFKQEAFYRTLQSAKSNKLALLSLPEILESDYKSWTESPTSSAQYDVKVNIGIASLVQDLPWLISHAGSFEKLVETLTSFAKSPAQDLALLVLITKGNAADGSFRKELAVIAFGPLGAKALDLFEGDATKELNLKHWEEDKEFLRVLGEVTSEQSGETTECKVWWQGDVSKSRKQVAPLLREAAKKA